MAAQAGAFKAGSIFKCMFYVSPAFKSSSNISELTHHMLDSYYTCRSTDIFDSRLVGLQQYYLAENIRVHDLEHTLEQAFH